MRRITTWVLSTISALVLLFSYHTSTNAAGTTSIVAAASASANGTSPGGTSSGGTSAGGTTSDGSTPTPTSTTSTTPSTGSTATPRMPPSTAPGAAAAAAGTFTGDAVQTQYGPVQVEITVTAGKVTTSVVTQVPWNDRMDQQINSYAVPILNGEAVQAQSAGIDMVSGATFTSDGYIQSLQSALDQAHG